MTAPADLFRHCPRCGVARSGPPGGNPFDCPACGLQLFFNPGVAAGVFIFDDADRVLWIRRAKDPHRGKLAVPGGFIDAGETADEGLRREVREEVGLEIDRLEYLCSTTNRYEYAGVTYPVVDLMFTAVAIAPERAAALDAVAGFEWRAVADMDPADFAFASVRRGWELLTGR